MKDTYTYGVARIRALENSLFTNDVIDQLISCRGYEECLGFLRDHGWGNGDANQSLDEMIRDKQLETGKIIEELLGDDDDKGILTADREYHNLKAAIKKACSDQVSGEIFFDGTSLDPEIATNAIRNATYEMLPEKMRAPAKEATETLLKTGDGQLCDIIIDKAALEFIRDTGKNSDSAMIRSYTDKLVTIANIRVAIRGAATGKDETFLNNSLVSCNGISKTGLLNAAGSGLDSVLSYIEESGYAEAVSSYKKSKSTFEKWCDDSLIYEIMPQKYESFSSGPILAYYIARDNEIKNVRIILQGKLSGFDDEFIKERVRVMYA